MTGLHKKGPACPSAPPIVFPPHPPPPANEVNQYFFPVPYCIPKWMFPSKPRSFARVPRRSSFQALGYGKSSLSTQMALSSADSDYLMLYVLFFDDGYVLGTNTPLPTLDAPRESIFAYWDYIATFDTHVIGHGMFWANDINSFTVRYNGWVVGTTITDKFDMTVYYTNNTPGIWYIYYDTAGLGTLGHSATIGAQSGETFVQFAYNRPGSVTSGTRLAIDTNCQGSFTKG
ncbi:hypothetical protein V866_004021 [Kwoniella sp. B9012]